MVTESLVLRINIGGKNPTIAYLQNVIANSDNTAMTELSQAIDDIVKYGRQPNLKQNLQ